LTHLTAGCHALPNHSQFPLGNTSARVNRGTSESVKGSSCCTFIRKEILTITAVAYYLKTLCLTILSNFSSPHPKLRVKHRCQVRRFDTEPYVESRIGRVQGPLAMSHLGPHETCKTHETVSSAASEANHPHGKRECDVHSLQVFTTHCTRKLYRVERQKACVQLRASPAQNRTNNRPPHIPSQDLFRTTMKSCHVCSHPSSCIFPSCLTSSAMQKVHAARRITRSHGFSLSALFLKSQSS
jgi:hypothetical protein